MGRAEVPKPQPKVQPTPSDASSPQAGDGQGKRQGPNQGQRQTRGQGQAQGQRQTNGQGRQDRGGKRSTRPGRPEQPRPERPEELKGENFARVVEHDKSSGVVTAFTEKALKLCRLKIKSSALLANNHRLYIGTDSAQRAEVTAILGMAHLDKMSNMAMQNLPSAIQAFIQEHAQYFVEEFYNKAGPMSLKQHSYELLPDIGPVKARNMVKAREQVGMFASMDELDNLAKINGAELLAQRFVEEIKDKSIEPRLIDLLLPVTT